MKKSYLTLAALSLTASIFSEQILEIESPLVLTSEPVDDTPYDETPSMCYCPETLESNFEIGGNYTHVNLQPHGSSSFNGNLGGVQALYEFRPKNDFYGAAKLAWRQGSTHGSAGKRHLIYIDAQERFGYTFDLGQKEKKLTLFSGLGFRHLGHKLHPKTGSSIRFNYNEFYVPVGLIVDGHVNSWFALGAAMAWMPQVYSTVKIVPLKGAHWTLTNTLKNFFVALSLDFALTESNRFHLILNPFYEYWRDGHTTAKTASGVALGLPGNSYNFWGVDLNFSYRF